MDVLRATLRGCYATSGFGQGQICGVARLQHQDARGVNYRLVTRLTARHNPNEPLSKRVVRGSAWLFSSYLLSRAGRMAMMLVVAALLSPREYGIIGLCTVIATAAQIVNEFGIWQAVVHRSEPDERYPRHGVHRKHPRRVLDDRRSLYGCSLDRGFLRAAGHDQLC
jgi:hypothetical protein